MCDGRSTLSLALELSMSLPFARSRRNAPRLRYHASMLLVSPTLVTIVLRLRVYVHTPGGASCAWMPASTSGGYSASALVVEIRSYDAKQYDRYEHPTPTAEGDVDS